MRFGLAAVLSLIASTALASGAGADRYFVEGSTTGALTNSANPTLLKGQKIATAVAHTCAASSCTRAAPSGDTSVEGILLDQVQSYRVEACLSTGTFSGGGVIERWIYNPHSATGQHWTRVVGGDLTPIASLGCISFLTQKNSFNGGGFRLVLRSNAVTVSTATPTLTVSVYACASGQAGCSP